MTVSFSANSQDTSKITITSDQLRTANLIFVEHAEYTKLIPLLKQENANLQVINNTWQRTDSLKTLQMYRQNQIMTQQEESMKHLQKRLHTSQTITGTAVGVSVIAVVLCLLLK